MKILVALAICLLVIASVGNTTPITANHEFVDIYDGMQDQWRDSVELAYIYAIHQSHGSHMFAGWTMLYQNGGDSAIPMNIRSDWWGMRFTNCNGGNAIGYNGDTCWTNSVRDTLTNNSSINFFTWSWSHAAASCDSTEVLALVAAMFHLAEDYPNVNIVIQTSRMRYPTDPQSTGDAIHQANIYLRQIADTVSLSNFHIFDQGEIMGYDRTAGAYDSTATCSTDAWIGTYVTDSSITPLGCTNLWATNLDPDSGGGWDMDPTFSSYHCHHAQGSDESAPFDCADAAGGYLCEMEAKAMSVLIAEAYGWDGDTTTVNPNIWYVSKSAGSDANGGHSWADAFRTIDAVNDSLRAGDTVIFAPGRYDSLQIIPPVGGNDSGWTLYIDSSKYYGGSGFGAELTGGESIGEFTLLSNTDSVDVWVNVGHAFRDAWAGAASNEGADNSRCWTLTYNGTMFKPHNDVDSLYKYGNYTMCHIDNAGGAANDTIYIGLPDGVDPSVYIIRASARPVFRFGTDGQNKIRIEGFKLSHGKQGVVLFTVGAIDSVQLVACSLQQVGHDYGENPSLVMSRVKAFGETSPPDSYKVATNVEIYNCDFTNGIGTDSSYYEHGMSGIEGYCSKFWRVKGCTFHDIPGTGVYWKNEIEIHDTMMANNVVDSCLFRNLGGYGVCAGETAIEDTVRNCIFVNIGEAAISLDHQTTNIHGGHAILNNTIDSANIGIWSWHTEDSTLTTTVKYNVILQNWATVWDGRKYRTGDYYKYYAFRVDANQANWDIDSNWYDNIILDSTSTPFYTSGDQNEAGWQAAGNDATAGGIYELFMNRTTHKFDDTTSFTIDVTHSGRTWTYPGANWGLNATTKHRRAKCKLNVSGNVRIQ